MARTLVLLGVTATLAGCLGSDDEDAAEEPLPAASTTIRIVRDDGSLPSRCGARKVATRVVQFLDAIERGDEVALDRLIADANRFQWFWSDGIEVYGKTATIDPSRENVGTDERPRLMRYLGARPEAGERIRLLHLRLNRVPPGQWLPPEVGTVVGLQFSVRRSARDLNRLVSPIAGGKGAVACSDSTILVWSSSPLADQPPSQRAVEVCGPRDTPKSPAGAIVCTDG